MIATRGCLSGRTTRASHSSSFTIYSCVLWSSSAQSGLPTRQGRRPVAGARGRHTPQQGIALHHRREREIILQRVVVHPLSCPSMAAGSRARISQTRGHHDTQRRLVCNGRRDRVGSGGEGIRRKVLCYESRVMAVRVEFERGALGAPHSHPHIQCSVVESGVFDITISGEVKRLKAGDSFPRPARRRSRRSRRRGRRARRRVHAHARGLRERLMHN